MAGLAKVIIFRGDAKTWPVRMSEDSWTPGGKLFFAAKKTVDDDVTDASAVIKKTMTDSDIVNSSSELYIAGYVTYEMDLTGGTDGDTDVAPDSYIAEFQFVDSLGEPSTGTQFLLIVKGDINRRVS